MINASLSRQPNKYTQTSYTKTRKEQMPTIHARDSKRHVELKQNANLNLSQKLDAHFRRRAERLQYIRMLVGDTLELFRQPSSFS